MSFSSINKPIPGSRNPVSYVNGLTASWLSTTTLTLNTGECSDSLNIIDMVVSDALTINAATTGPLGLDTGTLGVSKFYYVFVIGDSSGFNLPSALLSLSPTAPLMPYGYDTFRMVDIKVTDGSSHFLLSYTNGQYGDREFIYDAPLTTGSSALTTSYVALPLTACVAPIGTPSVKFVATLTPNSAGNIAYVQPTGSTGNETKLSGVVAAVAQIADLQCIAFVVTGVASVSLKATAATDTLVLLVKSFTYNV
jgi:hypothetical protein